MKRYFTEFIIIFGLGVSLTVLFTYPLINNLENNFFKNSDFYLNSWTLFYTFNSFKTGIFFNIPVFFNSPQLHPFASILAHQDFLAIHSILLYGPFNLITKNHIISTNLSLFITIFLNFISAYFCFRLLTKDKLSSFVGAIIFAYSPNVVWPLGGHIEYLNRYLIAPYFLLLINYFKKPSLKTAFGMYLAYTLNWFASIQIAIFITLITIGAFIINVIYNYFKAESNKFKKYISGLIKFSAVGFFYLPVIFVYFSPYLTYSIKEGLSRDVLETTNYSAKLDNFLPPMFAGEGTRAIFEYQGKHLLFPGFIPLCLILIFLFIKYKYKKLKFTQVLFVILLILCVIVSIGPFVTIFEHKIKLPYYYLYNIFPLLGAIRTPIRISYVWILFISYIAACGLSLVLARLKYSAQILVTILLSLLLILEYKEPYIPQILENFALKFNLKEDVVLFLPFRLNDPLINDSNYLFQNIGKQFKMVNGYTGSEFYIDDHLKIIDELSTYEFDERWFSISKALNIKYLVIDRQYTLTNVNSAVRLEDLAIKLVDSIKYSDPNWLVIDISGIGIPLCQKSEMSDLNLQFDLIAKREGSFMKYSGKNNLNCTLTYPGEKRYQKINYKVIGNNFKSNSGATLKTYLKLPPYLLPGDKFTKEIKIKKVNEKKFKIFDITFPKTLTYKLPTIFN